MRLPCVLAILSSLCVCPANRATVLTLGSAVVRSGQVTIAALSFASEGQAVSGVQFEIEWAAPLVIAVAAGGQIRASAKTLYTAMPSRNAQRLLITGLNATEIRDGDLLRCFLSVLPGSTAGTAHVTFKNVVATSPAGDAVSVRADSAIVSIESATSAATFPSEAILNAASLEPGPLCPGEIITILGAPDVSFVLINGTPAAILYAGIGQINAVIPFGLDMAHNARIDMKTDTRSVGSASASIAPTAPAVFTQAGTGIGAGAILNQDYSVNSFDNPAAADSILMVYGAGFGAVNPPTADGHISIGPAATTLPVTATIAGVPADVTYAGAAPGLIAGVAQINVRVPKGLPPNPSAPILLSVGGVTTAAGVTVALK
jgi:uncharacterized protein (TIGR03437 family)